MSYSPTVVTNVTQATTSVAQRGFGDIMIVDNHNWFLERFRQYSSIDAVAADIPSYANAYKAAVAAFSVAPKPQSIKIGRHRPGSQGQPCATITLETPAVGKVYSIKITGQDGSTLVPGTTPITYTAVGTDLAATTTSFLGVINGVTALAPIITASSPTAGVISITIDTATANFSLTAGVGITIDAPNPTESATNCFNAILAETDEFYAIATTYTTSTKTVDWSDAVAATKFTFWASTSDTTVLSTITNASDWQATLKNAGYPRTQIFYHHDALNLYPHVRAFCANTSYQPGDVIYCNKLINGVGFSKGATGLRLSDSEKSNLENRGVNYFDYQYKTSTLRHGTTQAQGVNAWIDNQIGADLIEARCNEAVFRTLINQNGSKLGMSAKGAAALESVLRTVLDGMTSTNTRARLLRSYDIITPSETDFTFDKVASRVITVTITAYLESATQDAVINVTLTYPGA